MRPRWMMTRPGAVLVPMLFGLLMAAAPAPAVAQRGIRGGPDRAELERRIRARFGQMVRERLGLTEDQAAELGRVVESFEEDRMDLGREEQALFRRVEALFLEDDASEDASREAGELLRRMGELRVREAQLFASEQERLSEVLTPIQVLRFLRMREQFGERIRQIQGRGMRGRPRGGPPGQGGGGGPPGGRTPGSGAGWLQPER